MESAQIPGEISTGGATLPAAAPFQISDETILQAKGIRKVFPGTIALDDVDFDVYRGKVNVLVGENGAGKSTLMKILAGVEQPTEGELLLEGTPVRFRTPLDAQAVGIGIIFQELHLFPNLSVVENIFMASELTIGRIAIDSQAEEARARDLMARLEQPIEPRTLVGELRLGEQQIVEIAKALSQNIRILIMDEPTSALSASEVAVLFRVIRELKAQGVSIIYISHKLEELLQIGDYLTVLRDGRVQAMARASEVDVNWVIEQMVGRNPATFFQREAHTIGEELLRVDDLCMARPGGGYLVDHVTFSLRAGEILGIYGLMGAGRTELLECLIGLHPEATGDIFLDGKKVKAKAIPERIGLGFALTPEDRQAAGLVQTLSVASNMTLASLRKFTSGFYLSARSEAAGVAQVISQLAIKVSNPDQSINALSGGNQQKVVVGKGLLTSPRVLLMDEPTRGIDVGAKSEMFAIMSELAGRGYGVLFVTSELKEILAMSDRILVMSKGRITGEYVRSEATEELLVKASAVGHGPAQAPGGNDGTA